jgi:hypothetical protein
MTKQTLLIIAIVVVILIVAGVLIFFPKSGVSPLTRSSNAPEGYQGDRAVSIGGPADDFPTGETVTLSTRGVSVEAKNFYKNIIRTAEGGSVVLAENNDYVILFNRAGNEFLLTVMGVPARTAQTRAEADFLGKLGIVEAQACRLAATVIIPMQGSIPGRSGPLSFCAGGVQ